MSLPGWLNAIWEMQKKWYDLMGIPYPGAPIPQPPTDVQSQQPLGTPDTSPPWAFPDDPHGVDTWDFSGGYGYPDPNAPNGKTPKKKKPGKGGRGQQLPRRQRKAKPVRIKPAPGAGNAGRATQAYPTASQATGGAMPLRELDALSEVGLTPLLAELVNHGKISNVSLATTLSAWQREQDRITNRTWRRPGGLYRPAGL